MTAGKHRVFRLLFLAPAAAFAIPVEVTHPVAPFLRRMEELGHAEPGFLSTLPRDDREVAAVLIRLSEKESMLGAWDRARLRRFQDEFIPERRAAGTRLRYRDSAFALHGGVEYFTGGYYRDSLPKPDRFAFGSFTPKVEAVYRDRLYLVSAATVGMERHALARFLENYDPQRGLPYNTNRDGKRGIPQGVSTFDGFRTVAGFGGPSLRLEAGQDWNQWGPGRWQHATLGARPHFWVTDSLAASPLVGFQGSDSLVPGGYRRGYRTPGEGPPLPQLRLRAGTGRWEYVKIAAQRMGLWTDSAAYLLAHRLQVRLGTWRVGLFEMMAVGPRGLDWAALTPGVPLKFAEHEGGDRDNIALGFDAEWIWTGRGRVYGEFYADDYSGPPFDFWGNKFALTLGGSWQDPVGLPSELALEFAQTDPWVFSHHRSNTALQSNGALLGSVLPPNARALFASWIFPLPFGAQGGVEWRWRRRDLQSPGSSIFDVHDLSLHGDKKAFLRAGLENRTELMATSEWRGKYAEARGGAGGLWVQGWRGQAGRDLATPAVFGEVKLRY